MDFTTLLDGYKLAFYHEWTNNFMSISEVQRGYKLKNASVAHALIRCMVTESELPN